MRILLVLFLPRVEGGDVLLEGLFGLLFVGLGSDHQRRVDSLLLDLLDLLTLFLLLGPPSPSSSFLILFLLLGLDPFLLGNEVLSGFFLLGLVIIEKRHLFFYMASI